MAIYPIFENRAVRDAEASEKEGREIHKDEIWVMLRVDANTQVEQPAEKWIAGLDQKLKNEKISPELHRAYKAAYQSYKDGNEAPLSGTDIRQWAQVSRATAENLISIGIKTVEDLATADDNTLRLIKHGSRELQNKARAFLESTDGKASERIVSLEDEVKVLREQNEKLLEALNENQQQPETPKKKKAK